VNEVVADAETGTAKPSGGDGLADLQKTTKLSVKY
jgi:hypothetical protein